MVCTLHWNPSTNEGTAELFTSLDGGETWSLRLTDESSHEVSDDACAFGEKGQAYFIAQPWDIRDPYAHHAELDKSDMHFYHSSNNGEAWPAHLTSAFLDYARIVVDSQPNSPFRGRAYIVGNRTTAETFPFIAVLEGGKQLVEAKQSRQLKEVSGKGGRYPRSLIVLRKGDVLPSYSYFQSCEPR